MDQKEKLIRQIFTLHRERGFQRFYQEFFACREAVCVYPDPTVRSRQLREHWDRLSEDEYRGFRKRFASMSVEELTAQLTTLKGLVEKTQSLNARQATAIAAREGRER
jgi:hypothetical protein